MATAKENNMNAYFQINYKTIEGFSTLLNRKTTGLLCDFVLCSTLYTPGMFSKHSHLSIPLSGMVNRKNHVMASIDQVCFFYTNHQMLSSLLLVVELVSMPIESSSPPFVLGWGSCLVDSSAKIRSPMKVRIPLHEGSACVLLTNELFKDDESVIVDIPGCIVTVLLSSHPTLAKAAHLIPKDTLVAFDDIIPGLIHTNIPEAFPKVLKSCPLSVEKLALTLVPSVEILECDFIESLKEDLTTQQIIIDERRVKFIPYNGWTTVSSPVVAHMILSEGINVHVPSAGQSCSSLCHSCLVFRGSLELPPLPHHHLTEVIIQLEYVLKLDRQLKPGYPPSSDSVTVILCWGVWRPFTDNDMPSCVNERYEVELKQGPGYETTTIPNSAYNTCYNNPNLTDIGRVTFVASSRPVGSKVTMSEVLSEVHVDLDQTNSSHIHMGIETADSGVTLDHDNEVIGQPQSMSTPRSSTTRPTTSTDTDNRTTIPSRIHTTEQTLTTTGTNIWVQPMSRSLLAHFYSSGVTKLTSCRGDVLSYVDLSIPTTNIDRSVFINQLLSKSIIIQMMGIEFLATTPLCTAVYSSFTPSAVSIGYHFINDTPTATDLHLVKLSSDNNLPFLLSLEKGGTLQTFKSNHFIPSDVPDSDKCRILNYFVKSGHIIFSVINYDSGVIIGIATLPIQIVSSCLTDNVYIPLCLPIVFNDTSGTVISTEALSNGDSAVTVGVLYLSIGVSSSFTQPMTLSLPSQPLLDTPTRSVVAYPLTGSANMCRTRKLARMKFAMDHYRFATNSVNEICSDEDEKHSSISSVLLNSLSCSVSIVCQFGEIAYFEYPFHNKSSEGLSVGIKWNNSDLCIVPSLDQVKYLRKYYNYKGITDDPAILSSDGNCQYKMFLAPNEKVVLPFRYTKHTFSQSGTCGNWKEKIEVTYYDSNRDDQLLSVLMVHVSVLYPSIDRVLHIHPSEGIYMKKDILIPLSVLNSIDEGAQQLIAVSSDNNTVCCIQQRYFKDSKHTGMVVNVKSPIRSSPHYSELLIALYCDQYMVAPIQVWRLCLQSVQRLEHSIVIGQSSSILVNIKGDHLSRKVTYHAHASNGVKVIVPTSHFIGANSLNEVSVFIKTFTIGFSYILLSAKDDMTGELVMVWSVHVTASRPPVSRAFTVTLPTTGDQVEKNIKWTNPYSKKKTFYLSSTNPTLVDFISESIMALVNKVTYGTTKLFLLPSIPQLT